MEDERRRGFGRRSVDARHAEVAVTGAAQSRGLAWGALVVLVVISTGASMALGIGYFRLLSSNDASALALDRANDGLRTQHLALRRANDALRIQHEQLIQGCVRLNVERAKTNASNLSDFLVDGVVLNFSSPSRATTREGQFESAFLPKLRYAVRAKRWTPLTNCVEAVNINGIAYRAPLSIRFLDRKPPASALDSRNASRPSPTGSVP